MRLLVSILVVIAAVAGLLFGLLSVLKDLVARGPHAAPELPPEADSWRWPYETPSTEDARRSQEGPSHQGAGPLDLDLARDFHHSFRSQIEPVDHLD
jgi:hypothetical protein